MKTQIARHPIPDTQLRLSLERVEVFGVAVPLVGGGFKNAYLTKTVQKSAIVRVTATGGAVGLGNIDPSPGYSTETIEESLAALRGKLAPGVTGADAANIHVLNARLDAATPGFLDAKAAIEMACVDLTARALGVPVHAYLGGAVKERLSFNAWIGIVPPTASRTALTRSRSASMPPPTLIFAERKPRSNHLRASAAASSGGKIPIHALKLRRSFIAPPR